MRPRVLKWLVCPLCLGELDLRAATRERTALSADDRDLFNRIAPIDGDDEVESDVTTGALTCGRCRVYYPIYNGVPRMLTYATSVAAIHARENATWLQRNLGGFALPHETPPVGEEAVLKSFSKEWGEYRWDEKSYWDVTPENMLRLKRYELGIPRHPLRHKLVIEVGIGIGGTADMLSRSEDCELVGIDLGYAVDTARRHFSGNPRLHIVQASVFALPLRPGAVDVLFSHGVLHHTYSTAAAFTSVAQVPKQDGGMLYVWLYSRDERRAGPARRLAMGVETVARPAISRMPGFLQAVVLAPILPVYILYQNLVRRRRLGARFAARYGWNEAMHAARDRLTPRFAHRHSYDEVVGWFASAGYDAIERLCDEPLPAGISHRYPLNVGVRGFRRRGA